MGEGYLILKMGKAWAYLRNEGKEENREIGQSGVKYQGHLSAGWEIGLLNQQWDMPAPKTEGKGRLQLHARIFRGGGEKTWGNSQLVTLIFCFEIWSSHDDE